MGPIIDSLAKGVSRFALGWAIPSALTLGLFGLFVFPQVDTHQPFSSVDSAIRASDLVLVLVVGLFIIAGSTIFSFLQVPIYRLLEGYTLPPRMQRWCMRRELRRWVILQRTRSHPGADRIRRELGVENLMLYPEDRAQLRPTRLGNALRAMEDYGTKRYFLDTQTLWYELLNSVPSCVRSDSEQSRGSVDFFVSALVHLVLLSVACLVCVPLADNAWPCVILAVGSVLLVRPAYLAAVRNVLEWRFTTQALVNLGRKPLAENLGFSLPSTYAHEVHLWYAMSHFVLDGDSRLWTATAERTGLDDYRRGDTASVSSAPASPRSSVSVSLSVGSSPDDTRADAGSN